MDRRKFLSFAGFTAIAGVAESFRLHRALAANWSNVGKGVGSAGTWQKLKRPGGPAYTSMAFGRNVVGAIRTDGLVYTCGENTYGGLGDNTGTSRSTYAQAIGISNPVALAAGDGHLLAIRSDGLVFATGRNIEGQLGYGIGGAGTQRSTFAQCVGISNAIAVGAGRYVSYAIRSDGLVFSCGYNNQWQLGDNTATWRSTFVQAIGISNAVAVGGGAFHSAALRADGSIFSCGNNTSGQLGDNSATARITFVQALSMTGVAAIACGYSHTVALRADGLVFGTGLNTNGQFGDNSLTNRSTFVQAIGISNAIGVGAGFAHSVVLRSDGRVFTSGINTYGQLGLNDAGAGTNRSTFVQAIGISNAIAVAGGIYNTIALRADGILFTTGVNDKGHVGDNTVVYRSTFVQAIWP